jgi:hypothetical protein
LLPWNMEKNPISSHVQDRVLRTSFQAVDGGFARNR